MCRSKANGGRRCSGSRTRNSGPPSDGKTRISVITNKRAYSVIGGGSNVPWMRGEKVVSMDVIEAAKGQGNE
jgi:hypothetical protein